MSIFVGTVFDSDSKGAELRVFVAQTLEEAKKKVIHTINRFSFDDAEATSTHEWNSEENIFYPVETNGCGSFYWGRVHEVQFCEVFSVNENV